LARGAGGPELAPHSLSPLGGDLAPSLGGRKKVSNDPFKEKISIFTPKVSDDLLLVIDRLLSVICLSLLSEI